MNSKGLRAVMNGERVTLAMVLEKGGCRRKDVRACTAAMQSVRIVRRIGKWCVMICFGDELSPRARRNRSLHVNCPLRIDDCFLSCQVLVAST